MQLLGSAFKMRICKSFLKRYWRYSELSKRNVRIASVLKEKEAFSLDL